jgi:hypothetical protein
MKKAKSRIQAIFRQKSHSAALETPEAEVDAKFGAGTILPPELFPRVLQYVSGDDRRIEAHERFLKSRPRKFDPKKEHIRYDQEIAMAGPLYTLKSCSLVCGYWANQCRKYMFHKATATFRSLQDVEVFRLYTTQGSERLIPICKLISALEVHQSYSSSRSYADLVYTPATKKKLMLLKIQGPVPANFPPAKLDSPHWGLMNSGIIPPQATSYKRLSIHDVTYPSFSHLLRYLKHFGDTEEFDFFKLDWGGKASESIAQFEKPRSRARDRIMITVRGCTDNFAICEQTAMMYSDSALRIIPDRDQRWAMQITRNLFEFYSKISLYYGRGPQVEIDNIVYEIDSSK